MTKTQWSVWEAQLLSRALLWKPPLGPNPPFWSHPTHIIHLCNNARHASNLYPLHSPETTIPKSLDAGVKARTATPVWAVIIWLGLCRIKPRPAKIPRRRKRMRDLHHHPPVQGRDRMEANGSTLDAAICSRTPPWKNNITGRVFFFPFIICCDSTPNWEKCDFFFFPDTDPSPADCSNL